MASLGDQCPWLAARCRSFLSRGNSRTNRGRIERLLRLTGSKRSKPHEHACPLRPESDPQSIALEHLIVTRGTTACGCGTVGIESWGSARRDGFEPVGRCEGLFVSWSQPML